MFKKVGLLALMVFGVAGMLPATASAQDGYYYGRPQPYNNYYYNSDGNWGRRARREWKQEQREERREERWRERHWRANEWREHERYENRSYYSNPDRRYYDNSYYGYSR